MINIFIFIISVVLLAVIASLFVFKKKRKNYKHIAKILEEFLNYAIREQLQGLIVLERNDNLDRFVATGHKLELKVKTLALAQRFPKDNENNAGAVVIKNNAIVAENALILGSGPNYLSPRQRLASNLTDQTDALVIVFEKGEILLFIQGQRTQISPERLVAILTFKSNKRKIQIN